MKRIKGLLIAIAFLSIALGLAFQPDVGLMAYMADHSVQVSWWVGAFVVSGLGNLFMAATNRGWNAALFAVFFAYTTMLWIASVGNWGIPVAQAVSHTLLSTFLVLEIVEEASIWKTSQ